MRSLINAAVVVFFLVLVLIIATFVLENLQGITLSFLGFSLLHLPLSVVVISAFLIGMLLGPLCTFLYGRIERKRRRV
ncbi:lipopolysaccharide assembly protein LapA domain-containing protein [Pseudomonas sp. Z3-8]|uniref:lipopolysaccharide assembly protein LapA domain-containing protein n=1 Tax=unclassified Pseudomonas TaxID=196821 RepID=UPI003DA9F3BB